MFSAKALFNSIQQSSKSFRLGLALIKVAYFVRNLKANTLLVFVMVYHSTRPASQWAVELSEASHRHNSINFPYLEKKNWSDHRRQKKKKDGEGLQMDDTAMFNSTPTFYPISLGYSKVRLCQAPPTPVLVP